MSETKKSYLSDYALSINSERWLTMSASQLMSGGVIADEDIQSTIDASHIYIISKVPAIRFCPESHGYEGGILSGKLLYSINGELKSKEFAFPFELMDDAVEVKLSPYPHREVITCNASGEQVRYLQASLLSNALRWHNEENELRDFEVLYIGQSFGDGTRTAFERLKSHSTFQKILADLQYQNPEYEVQLFMFEFSDYSVITQFDGRAKNVIDDYRDLDRFRSIIDNPLSLKEQICLIEATLIRYFNPEYNKTYKDSFPDQKHKILESCYDLDFSALIVFMNVEELGYRLWSPSVAPHWRHSCNIDLLDPKERLGFFYISNGDDGFFKFGNPIERK